MKNWTLALTALALAASLTSAQTTKPAPDLHAGGPQPSSIPNHATTEVTLPGLHLAGTSVTASGACTLKSYKVVSDTEITMKIEGNRAVDAKDDGCFFTVHQGAKHAGSYVIVELTEAEEAQKNAGENAAAKSKADTYMSSLGTQWTLHYADGATETLTAQPAAPGELPDFTSNSGATAKIMLSGSTVMIIANPCILSGTLTGNQVKDGKVYSGECKHPGAWTGQKK